MKNFLAVYRGEPSRGHDEWNKLSKEEQQSIQKKGIEAWKDWAANHSESVIFNGGPLGKTLRVDNSGVSSVKNWDCAYVVIRANSHEEAAEMFKQHPHFAIFPGECVEIMEELPIPGP